MRVGARCRGARGGESIASGTTADSELIQDVLGEKDISRSAILVFVDAKDLFASGVDALSEGGMVTGEHEFEELGGAGGVGVDLNLGRGV